MNRHFFFLFLPVHILGATSAWLYRDQWDLSHVSTIVVATFLILVVGVNLGLHRILAHKHFEGHFGDYVTNVFVFFSLFAGGGRPLAWVAIHRHHHRYSDTELDIHSPRRGFLNSFWLWMIRSDHSNSFKISLLSSRDLRKSTIVCLFDRFYYPTVWATIAVLFLCFGFQSMSCVIIFPMIISIMHESAINYFCHIGESTSTLGYRNFRTQDSSLNYLVWGWMSFGAAYQNNHHFSPNEANFARLPAEVDLTYLAVRCISWLASLLRNLR